MDSTPTPPDVASDADIAAIREKMEEYSTWEDCDWDVKRILNRLSASESRVKEQDAKIAELERENEWARLLYKAMNAFGGFRLEMGGDRSLWMIPKGGDKDAICIGKYTGNIPLRPDDMTVQKIAEAVR